MNYMKKGLKNYFMNKSFLSISSSPYIMPEEYKGKITKNGGLTNFAPRQWTKEEIDWVLMLKEKRFNIKQISEYIDRDSTQVSIKLKRLGKKNKSYNDPHREDKYETNEKFLKSEKINSVLDVFSGEKSFYENRALSKVITNDINKNFNTDYHYDALTLCCLQYAEGSKYDLVDLDPFGSAYDCFDLAIKIAKKGIIITLGELGHKRFKRLDYVRRYYGIEKLKDFTSDNLIKHIIKIGERNKKVLTPIYIKDWRNIARVYFRIKQLKITEQWENKEKNILTIF